MRILFTGAAPWCQTGYAKPLRSLFPRLAALGHEIALAPFYGYAGATTQTKVGGAEIRIYPPARAPYLNDIIEFHAGSWQADAVITLQDVWILDNWGHRGFRWYPWMPVDTDPVSDNILKAIEGCQQPLVWCRWAQKQLQDHGWPNARYVPFGVDCELHQPMDQAQARVLAGLPEDGFIAGMVAANSSTPSRKSFPEVLLAWREWWVHGGEGILYLHTTITNKRQQFGLDLGRLLATLGLPWSTLDDPDPVRRQAAAVLFPAQHRLWCGAYDDQALVFLYNSFDVLLSPSMSEGFGIPIVEAQACGVPVVTLAFSSMPELTFAGLCLDPVQRSWEEQGGWRGVPSVADILKAITWSADVLRTKGGKRHYAGRALAGAREFDWPVVMARYWEPFLEEIADAGK